MKQAERRVLLEKLRRQAELCAAPRSARLRRLPFRLVLPRALNAAGRTQRVTARTIFDRDIRVHLPDLVGVKLYQYGFFEEGLTRALIEKVPQGGVFIDIGAHVGYFTMLASLISGVGFGLYLARFANNYVTMYAGLASVIIALVFLYFIAAIFVFGGELNAAIIKSRLPRGVSLQAAQSLEPGEKQA